MAYSDIQDRLDKQLTANRILLAEKYSQGNLFPKGSEGNPYSKNPRAEAARKKRAYKKAQEEKKKLPSDADIQTKGNMQGQPAPEEIFGEDYEGGPTYLNTLLQIGGAAGSMIPFMGGNMLKMLIGGPKVMAGAQDIDTKELILRNGMFVDENQIKYMWSPREQKFIDMGPYDPYYDGLPIVQNQRNDDMKIAGLPHTPPTEKMVVGKKLMDSPLRFRTDAERIRFMEDFAKYDRPRA